jgi:DNA-binding NarL/FixJ family response regulator
MPRTEQRKAARPRQDALGGLTARELEILALLAAGARSRTIATDLGIAEPTVKRHITNLYRKLGVTSRVEAATLYVREQPRGRR